MSHVAEERQTSFANRESASEIEPTTCTGIPLARARARVRLFIPRNRYREESRVWTIIGDFLRSKFAATLVTIDNTA